jgi:hypothetical protein
VPSVNVVGEAEADLMVDRVNPGKILMLMVPDSVQNLDVIVGRSWLDQPTVAYRKADGQLHIYEAELSTEAVTVGAASHDRESDYFNLVELSGEPPVRMPLVLEDFGYVNEHETVEEMDHLMKLLNEYRDCFAKCLEDLGCTPLMQVVIHEIPGSTPVVCRPYKNSQVDREEIHNTVADWKRCGLVNETISLYASPVFLVKQGRKSRLCVAPT